MDTNGETRIVRSAEALYNALKSCVQIEAISKSDGSISVDDAYAIQMKNIERELAAGAAITGKKIGLTSEAMQRLLGVGEPDYGHLLSNMHVTDEMIPIESMLQPKVEGEIAFVLKDDLCGPNITPEDVIEATDYVVGALEIVDSRVRDWKITLIDTVADNASSGRYVLGEDRRRPGDIDLPSEQMRLSKNGEKVNSGCGMDIMGNPAFCVAWLANKLSDYRVTLRKGEVILSGALSAAAEAGRGDTFTADFSHLGSVMVKFV